MSERMTMVGRLCDRLGTIRSQMNHDIRELEHTGYTPYNPSEEQVRQMIQRHEDDHHELMAMMTRVADLDPVPLPGGLTRHAEAGLPEPEWTIE